ncbi:MAG: helix-turn-helix transcriptional regulator [Tissierellia bacterium]|nr:helix-turn-helix transcriptional regulator [Tissierellia bacterium]
MTDEILEALEILHEGDVLTTLSEIFQALSDPTRLEIICCLGRRPMYVEELAMALNKSQSSVSHQLRTLRNLRLVKFVKDGRRSIYELDDDHVHELFHQGLEHARHKH